MEEYKIHLSEHNIALIENEIVYYQRRVWGDSTSIYLIPQDSPNYAELTILEILRIAYSKHPGFNPKFGREYLTKSELFEILDPQYSLQKILDRNGKFPAELLSYFIHKATKDLLRFYAQTEFSELLTFLSNYCPYFMHSNYYDEEMLRYFTQFEPKFESYNRKTRSGIIPIPQSLSDQYHTDFKNNPFVIKEQCRILVREWGNRNPIDGRPIDVDINGYPVESITRHHFLVSDPFNKLDCSISALVPIPTAEHKPTAEPHTPNWEKRFSLAKEYIERGIPVIPSWWTINNQIEYEQELKQQGINYFVFI